MGIRDHGQRTEAVGVAGSAWRGSARRSSSTLARRSPAPPPLLSDLASWGRKEGLGLGQLSSELSGRTQCGDKPVLSPHWVLPERSAWRSVERKRDSRLQLGTEFSDQFSVALTARVPGLRIREPH